MKKPIYSLLMLLLFSGAFSGCEDILDIEPEEIILEEEAFETEDDLQQFLNSTYDVLANTFDGRSQALSECLTDNLAAPRSNDDLTEVFQRNSNFFNGTINNYYKEPYIVAFRANLLLTKFDLFPNLSESRKVQMEAEARFVRALAHFDVVRLFAQPFGFTPDNGHLGVVLATQTFDTPQPRATVRAVYNQIIEDLQFAENALPETNGVYADRNAARALLAKVYFQQNDFVNAADYAGQVINSGRYQLGPLNRYTAEANPESVFATVSTVDQSIGINDVRSGAYTGNYRESNAGGATLNIAADLYAIATADTSDLRAAFYGVTNEGQANQYFWMNKFDADWFNVPILNLTDMKLIRAESLGELGLDLPTAIADINDIRDRAFGAGNNQLSDNTSAANVVAAARQERRLEFVGEGDRLNQLKRRGTMGENVIIRGSIWSCPGMVLQFPVAERSDVFELNPTGGC